MVVTKINDVFRKSAKDKQKKKVEERRGKKKLAKNNKFKNCGKVRTERGEIIVKNKLRNTTKSE